MDEHLAIDLVLLSLIAVMAVAVIEVRSLFAAVLLAGIYSLMMSLEWFTLHAVDVAFTEAAVGAGISTILLIGALVHVGRVERKPRHRLDLRGLAVVLLAGGMLVLGTLDMPAYGDPSAPVHTHRVPRLIEQQVGKVDADPARLAQMRADPSDLDDDDHGHVPNTVTSLLASYRGLDTMFETAVILIAGVGLLLLLQPRRREGPS